MPIFDEYDQYDATGLAGLIANGEVCADEILETAIGRIESLNPSFNAVIASCTEAARSPDGLPVGVHIGAAFGQEALLLRLAHALELATPWHQRI